MISGSDLIAFAGLVTLISSIGIFGAKRTQSKDAYLLADRQTGLFALTATLVMTEFNTSTLLAFSAMGYFVGWWALVLPLVFLIGLLFYAMTVAKPWKRFNGVSVAHFFTQRYGKDIGWLAAVFLYIAMVGFTATYVKSMTLIFVPLFPAINFWLLSALLVLLTLLMVWRGGLFAIIRVDVVSFVFILFFFPLIFYGVFHLPDTEVIPQLNLAQMQALLKPGFVGSLILLTMFSYLLAPWYAQKIVAARDQRVAYKGAFLAAFLVFVLYSIGISACVLLKNKGVQLKNADLAFPYLLYFGLPKGLQGLFCGVLFCIAATTLSGVWSAMVTLLVGQFSGSNQGIRKPLVLMFLCALLSYLGANLFVDNLLNKMILANIPVVALSYALLAGFYWRRSSRLGVYVSIIVGVSWGIGCYQYYGEEGMHIWYWAVYGIPLIFASGILGSLLSTAWVLPRRVLSSFF